MRTVTARRLEHEWHRLLRRHASAHRRGLALACLMTVSKAVLTLALPWPVKLAVDYVVVGRPLPGAVGWVTRLSGTPTGALVLLAVGLVVLAVFAAGLNLAYRVLRRTLGAQMSNELAADSLQRVQRRSLLSLSRHHIAGGDLVQRIIADTKCIDTLVFGVWMMVFQSGVTFVLLGGVVLAMTGLLAVVTVAVAILMFLAIRLFRDRLQDDALAVADAQAAVSTGVVGMLATVPEIQSFAAEDVELERFRADLKAQLGATMRSQRTSLLFGLSTSAVTALGTGALMLFGGLRVLDGTLTVGELLVLLSYVAALYGPVEGLASVSQSHATARAGARRVLALTAIDGELPEPERPAGMPPARRGAAITFTNVSFSYREGERVLRGLSLHIPEGQVVGLVGGSGVGKTTLLSLVPRLFDPSEGSVRIDGVDLRDVRLRDVRSRVALVSQDPLLLPVSVRDNIRYGTPEASDADVEHAADHALATEFVERLPEGFDTVLGEGGVTLSGGQRQRLSIARALCRKAPILLLDEPTAALDSRSEAQLLTLLAREARGRTLLVIAHRLSTVRQADRIIVVGRGGVVEDGTPAELLEAGGTYARYVAAQSTQPTEAPPGPAASVVSSGGVDIRDGEA